MVLRNLSLIIVAGLFASGVFAVFSGYATSGPDAVQYDTIGFNLASGRGFSLETLAPFTPTMYREPGYPMFLGMIYVVFGHNIQIVLFAQMLLHATTAVLVYYITRDMFTEKAAFFSGLAVALFPTLANMSAYILSETFFTFFLCLGLWCYSHALKKRKVGWFVISGIVFGAMTLTKTAALFLPLGFVLATILMALAGRLGTKRLLACLTIFLLSFSLFVSTWAVRNKALFNKASLTLRGGDALWSRAQKLDDSGETILATACYSFSEYLGSKAFPGAAEKPERYLFKDFEKAAALRNEYSARGVPSEQFDEILTREAVGSIAKQPLKYAAYTFIEAIKMTAFTYLPILNEPAVRNIFAGMKGGVLMLSTIKGVMRILAYPILLLFLAALIKHRALWDKWLLLCVAVVYFNVIYSLLDAIGRYAVPLIPFYCIMAVAALVVDAEKKIN